MNTMLSPLKLCKGFICSLIVAVPLIGNCELVTPLGSNYVPVGTRPGDQVFPHADLNPNGGYLVWGDDVIDGDGSGIAARRLDRNQTGLHSVFRVNAIAAGNQDKPRVLMLPDDGAVFVWQGGLGAGQHIYLRFISPDGTFPTAQETRVDTTPNPAHRSAALSRADNGNIMVAWASESEDGHLEGVYGRILDSSGSFQTDAFKVNQYTGYNQRDPAVLGLASGRFVVVWVSENQGVPAVDVLVGQHQIHVYARLFESNGQPVGDEFKVNGNSTLCANPSISRAANGGFIVAWSHGGPHPSGWDICARLYDGGGNSTAGIFKVNSFDYGDQYAPTVSAVGANNLVVWTSLGQDGSWEGVYSQLLVNGNKFGPESRVNQTAAGRQMQAMVASDDSDSFLVAWSSWVQGDRFDLFAQRYDSTQLLAALTAPYAAAVGQTRIMVTWTAQIGMDVGHYEIYMDGSSVVTATTSSNIWFATGLGVGTTHAFQIAYVQSNGQRSPRSEPVTVTTWGVDSNQDGLPDNWQAAYWGIKVNDWSAAWVDEDGDGVSNYNEFLAGSDPRDPSSSFRIDIEALGPAHNLTWQARPGFVYQLQVANDLESWMNWGSPRLSTGTRDSLTVPQTEAATYYRLIRVR